VTRQVLAVAAVLLTLTAGCAGMLAAPEQSTAPADESWTDGDDVEFQTLFASHRQHVAAADSVTKTRTVSQPVADPAELTVRLDRDSEQLYSAFVVGTEQRASVRAVYITDGTRYERSGPRDSPEYANRSLATGFEYEAADAVAFTENAAAVAQWNWEYEGFEDGAYRFSADSVTHDPAAPQGVHPVALADSASGTLVVDERGFVRRLALETTVVDDGERLTHRTVTEYGALNDTTVDEPDWRSAA
jgi:hypothetical protein